MVSQAAIQPRVKIILTAFLLLPLTLRVDSPEESWGIWGNARDGTETSADWLSIFPCSILPLPSKFLDEKLTFQKSLGLME